MYLHMLLIVTFSVKISSYSFAEINGKCTAKHNKTLPNDYLLGTWYILYQFGSSMPETEFCPMIEFSKPTAKNIEEYRRKYNLTGMPFDFEGDPIVMEQNMVKGLVMGDKEVKYFILDPDEVLAYREIYTLYAFKKLSEKYAIFFQCEMREYVLWVLSRDKRPSVNETDTLINSNPYFIGRKLRRYCVDKIKTYPLVQNGNVCRCHCCTYE